MSDRIEFGPVASGDTIDADDWNEIFEAVQEKQRGIVTSELILSDFESTLFNGNVLDMPFGEPTEETIKDEDPNGGYHGTNMFGMVIRPHQRTRLNTAVIDAESSGESVVRLYTYDNGVDELIREWTFDVTSGINTVSLGEWIDPANGDYWLGRWSGVNLQRTDTGNTPVYGDSLSILLGVTSNGGSLNTRYYYFFRLNVSFVSPELTGSEQVLNGDFEDWTGGDPDDWNIGGTDIYDVNEVTVGNLTVAEVVTKVGSSQRALEQDFTGLEGGKAYKVRFRARRSAGAQSWRWAFENATDTEIIIPFGGESNDEFKWFEFTFVALSSKTYTLLFSTSSSTTDNTFQVTDVSIKEITANDESGEGNHGEIRAADNEEGPRLVAGPKPGMKAWEFANTRETIVWQEIDTANPIRDLSQISWGAWVRMRSNRSNDQMVQSLRSRDYWRVTTDGRVLASLNIDDSQETTTTTGSITDEEWHHVFVTYDNEAIKIYFDGSLERTRNVAGTYKPNSATEYLVGGYTLTNPQSFLDGDVARPLIFNRALSAEEVKGLHARGPEWLEDEKTKVVDLFNFE